ncbi:MAG: hypothetical protein EOP09_20805 [Proteobacteria bacterium]|nr:MAG: hypothetical protein EOP09_20805 [Pseudomonadota bacterium]
MADDTLLDFTALIVANHVTNNHVTAAELPGLIKSVHSTLKGLGAPQVEPPEELKPAVTIRSSVKPDSITCLECGTKFKMLKKHLGTDHGITPYEYRQRWSRRQRDT